MALCYLEIKVDLPYSQNLKEKRGIIKSIISRSSKKFNISIAEIDLNDFWQSALLGIALVSNDGKTFDNVIKNLVNFLEINYPDIIISITAKEVF
jgi:hypothetical protein